MKKLYYSVLATAVSVCCIFPMNAQKQSKIDSTIQTQQEQAARDSINTILAQAKEGDAIAQNEVGAWYYQGKHVKQDYQEAVQWWLKAAKQNNSKAIGNLGLCYETGHGVERDSLRAVGLYNRSIKEGNVALFEQNLRQANNDKIFYCVYVANCFKNGIGTSKDLSKATFYFEKAAKKGVVDSQKELAMILLNSKQNAEALKWFKLAASQNDLTSEFYYGKLLFDGNGVPADKQEGMIYLLRSAENGFPMGQYEVAKAYYEGNGAVKNVEQGAEWLIKAANNGVSKAQYELAMNYIFGNGLQTDYDQAASWFAICLPKGHSNAFKKLFEEGKLSMKGTAFHAYLKGLKYYYDRDFDNANKQFKIVEKAKHKEGKTMQGVILANKDFEKYNLKKGLKLLQDAAKVNNSLAMYLLGGIFEAGKGVEKDMKKAISYLEQAANLNYAPALCYLGDMYYEGRGVEQDYSRAVEYYVKAKGQLTANAMKRLAVCYENGQGVESNVELAEQIRKRQNGSISDLLKLVPMN